MSLKLGKFGAFIGCSNYPECKYTRVLSPTGAESAEGERPGVRVLGQDPETGDEITSAQRPLRRLCAAGRRREAQKRSSLPRGLKPDDVTLEKALALLSLPREVARHPTSGEPILAGIGRYGAYVQHGKTYANLGRDDDVLEIGGNRAIDLIVAKESGAGVALRRRRRGPRARRPSRRRRGQRQGRAASGLMSTTARSTPRCPREPTRRA